MSEAACGSMPQLSQTGTETRRRMVMMVSEAVSDLCIPSTERGRERAPLGDPAGGDAGRACSSLQVHQTSDTRFQHFPTPIRTSAEGTIFTRPRASIRSEATHRNLRRNSGFSSVWRDLP